MFTGIILAVGRIDSVERTGEDASLTIATGGLDLSSSAIGDSIAVNGVCLTAVALGGNSFVADVSGETLARTTLADMGSGRHVNLELALTPDTRLGGHLVSGHVDGIGKLVERREQGRSVRMRFQAPKSLARYIAEKGSICVDGVSLTVNAVEGAVFDLNIVPHTLKETVLGEYRVGQRVNLEVDIIARYLERLLMGEHSAEPGAGISRQILEAHGFIKT
jgi:riboflavin synthase